MSPDLVDNSVQLVAQDLQSVVLRGNAFFLALRSLRTLTTFIRREKKWGVPVETYGVRLVLCSLSARICSLPTQKNSSPFGDESEIYLKDLNDSKDIKVFS